jgi:hypothetical protein
VPCVAVSLGRVVRSFLSFVTTVPKPPAYGSSTWRGLLSGPSPSALQEWPLSSGLPLHVHILPEPRLHNLRNPPLPYAISAEISPDELTSAPPSRTYSTAYRKYPGMGSRSCLDKDRTAEESYVHALRRHGIFLHRRQTFSPRRLPVRTPPLV